ncbi:hypothetical protein WR25_17599 [Diploscapter pachys]|uniref:Peptidase C1A papain C-terminal domain-containing protein n=1 Tax=Diploscapter pachys TaxID=2018661 RepID=A0A2A2JAQ5_9BILA|nr:hypothetical protein WR25_17599 [Diploscapter pachys]
MILKAIPVFLIFQITVAFSGLKIPEPQIYADSGSQSLSHHECVETVNKNAKHWKAELHRRFSKLDKATLHLNISLPESFDARDWWTECPMIAHVRDQSSCGSCWAFGCVEAISDRICISTKGKSQPIISAAELMECCADCGEGCYGGWPYEAWKFWVERGIVTGGDYANDATCQPYPFPSCAHSNSAMDICNNGGMFKTPICSQKCQTNYSKDFNADKYYGLVSYGVKNDEEAIMKELVTYGPVEVAFDVYEDFVHYKSGVYKHTVGELLGGHAVKLIGYGVEDGIKYWLIVNSWGSDWGDNGTFKIIRGQNECNIESGVVAGIPKTDD